ncbi:hypothetical protein [Dyadobacter psychrophilus]|uniref:Lipoprotein n=1 Tax=Dyadobacter psychrophilus TaxID=651661 RepID=A0A1T5EQ20_9BACT|nr:hypothetical protein [Dyadobacter psychrophilus]SKB85958.1 hypothetical protein SAMN05660293_02670 [Dyadobacter psychrophilus]
MGKRLSVFGIIFLSLFLFSYSCQDHEIPGVPPSLVTLEVSPGAIRCEIAFNLNVVDTGNMPVTEFGVVIAGFGFLGQASDTPTVGTHTKLVFDPPFSTGNKKKNSGVCSNQFSYRAYAILNNGTVIYGNLLSYQDV